MAKVQSPPCKARALFSMTAVAEVRMLVEARDAAQAEEIMRSVLGGTEWTKTQEIGLPFAIKLVPKPKKKATG
jgi:hypothetical protein